MSNTPEKRDSRHDDADALVKLATARFVKLTPAEEKLFRQTAMGKNADYLSENSNENNPADGMNWAEERVLHADRIAWLCANKKARKYITHRGLQIKGARIEDALDLQAVCLRYPFGLLECSIAHVIILLDCQFVGLGLTGSHTQAFYGDRMTVEGSVFLNRGFHSKGEVSLLGATIGGNLVCERGTFNNPEDTSINADAMKVGGDVFLRGGFHADGEVRLLGVRIGGNLECSRGVFSNPDGTAFNLDGMKVEGNVFLSEEFHAEGKVRLIGAEIGGDLDCHDGTFINQPAPGDPGIHSLCAERILVKGNVFLTDGFHAEGEVSLIGTSIGGDLKCDDGAFINPDGYALSANRMKIGGHVFLREEFEANGKLSFASTIIKSEFQLRTVDPQSSFELDLRSSSFGGFWDDPEKWPKKENLTKLQLQGLIYDDFVKGSPSDAGSRIEWLKLQGDKEYFPQPYEQLAAVLKKNGHVEDARDVLIAKEKHRKHTVRLSFWYWPWYYFFGPSIGYGYQPFSSVGYAVIIILLGMAFFLDGRNLLAPASGESLAPTTEQVFALSAEDVNLYYVAADAFMYSVDTFIPILDFHQVMHRLPDANLVSKSEGVLWPAQSGFRLLVWFWFEIAAGWVITSLLIVGLTRFVRS